MARLVCQFASITILARLLAPADFGLVASVASMVTVVNLLRELGLAHAIVQREKIEDGELSCLFRFTVLLGIFLLVLSVGIGAFAAWFFQKSELFWIAPFFGLAALLSSVEVIPLGLMRRQLLFHRIAIREIMAAFLGTSFGIAAASFGVGYWALVISPVVMQLTNTLFSWMAISWRPSCNAPPLRAAFPYLKFGGTMTVGEFANFLCRSLDQFVIGKLWGFTSLGYYSRGLTLIHVPVDQLSAPVNSTLLPILTKMKDDPQRRRQWIERIYLGVLVMGGVAAAWVFVNADGIVTLLLGNGWEEVPQVLIALSPLILIRPAGGTLYALLVSEGRLKDLISWTWIGAIISISLISISASSGIVVVAMSLSLAGLLRTVVSIYYASNIEAVSAKTLFGILGIGIINYVVCAVLLRGLFAIPVFSQWHLIVTMTISGLLAVAFLMIGICLSPFWRSLAIDSVARIRQRFC